MRAVWDALGIREPGHRLIGHDIVESIDEGLIAKGIAQDRLERADRLLADTAAAASEAKRLRDQRLALK